MSDSTKFVQWSFMDNILPLLLGLIALMSIHYVIYLMLKTGKKWEESLPRKLKERSLRDATTMLNRGRV